MTLVSCLFGACGVENSKPALDRLSPEYVQIGTRTDVLLHGENFFPSVRIDLDQSEEAVLDRSFVVHIGDFEVPPESIQWIDQSQIQITAPASLELGDFNVTLTVPNQDPITLTDALHVVQMLPVFDAGIPDGDGGPDAALADAGPADAAVPPDCTGTVCSFATPVVVPELSSSSNDDYPTVTNDLLEMYIHSDRAGGLGGGDIWVSTRSSLSDPWGTPSAVTELNTTSREESPGVSGDGLRLYFQSDRPGSVGRDIWLSTRALRTDPWGTPALVPELNLGNNDRDAQENSNGLMMAAFSTGAPIRSIVRAAIGDLWGTGTEHSEVVATNRQEGPMLVGDDGLILLYFSDQDDAVGASDIYVGTRTTGSAPFSNISNVGDLNTTANDQNPWSSADMSYVLFASDRDGSLSIYETRLLP